MSPGLMLTCVQSQVQSYFNSNQVAPGAPSSLGQLEAGDPALHAFLLKYPAVTAGSMLHPLLQALRAQPLEQGLPLMC